jgi:hypothetical protein
MLDPGARCIHSRSASTPERVKGLRRQPCSRSDGAAVGLPPRKEFQVTLHAVEALGLEMEQRLDGLGPGNGADLLWVVAACRLLEAENK